MQKIQRTHFGKVTMTISLPNMVTLFPIWDKQHFATKTNKHHFGIFMVLYIHTRNSMREKRSIKGLPFGLILISFALILSKQKTI